MPPFVALTIGICLILFLFRESLKKNESDSKLFWIFSIWFMLICSRNLANWLHGGNNSEIVTNTEGNPINLISDVIFSCFAMYALVKKRINIAIVLQQNVWLLILFAYCLMSCVWSDNPLISFRRWIRMILNVIVVLAILSEPNKISTIKKLFERLAIFAIPLSIVLIKYFPHLAVGWDAIGTGKMWMGVCMHKNTLGVTLSACLLFFIWKWIIIKDYKTIKIDIFLFAIASYIIFNPNVKGSSTAILSLVVAIGVLICVKIFQNKIQKFSIIFYAIIFSYFVADTGSQILFNTNILKYITLSSGRDMTFTGRTFIWDAVKEEAAKNPIIGTGYGMFWTGNRFIRLQSKPLLRGIRQAHNGYLETYANLGIIGLILLIVVLFIALNRNIRDVAKDYQYYSIATAFIVQDILTEFFEATVLSPSFSRWIITLLFIIRIPESNACTQFGKINL